MLDLQAAGAANPASSVSTETVEKRRARPLRSLVCLGVLATKTSGPLFFRAFFFGRAITNSPGANWDIRRMARRAKSRDGLRIKDLARGGETWHQAWCKSGNQLDTDGDDKVSPG